MADTKHYTVLARKYRPSGFEDLIGQDAMVQTLRNAFTSGRIAQAYMLTGVRGVGKTTTARILARALNYSIPDKVSSPTIDMSEMGEHCEAIMASSHVDVLEMDAASHTGVENIRELIESARYKPVIARYKVYIIDEVHMLSKGAFNALLKTLEEPPEHVKFIFATTEIRKVPVTVLSRCQRFNLQRISIELLVKQFQKISNAEAAQADEDALGIIARAAEGSCRDGLSILDQAIAMGSGKVTMNVVQSMLGLTDRIRIFELLETIFSGEVLKTLEVVKTLHQNGTEPGQLLSDIAEAVHLITKAKVVGIKNSDQMMSETEQQKVLELSEKLSLPLLGRAWQMLLKGFKEVDNAPQPIAALEMILIRMVYVADLPPPDEIIRSLEHGSTTQGSGMQPTSSKSTNDRPKMQSVMSGTNNVVMSNSPALNPHGIADQESDPTFENFEQIVAFVAQKRDLKLKINLEKHARPVKFKHGHIEIQLGPDAPRHLANDLNNKLNEWTNERWIVVLSKEKGGKTIAEQRDEKEAAEMEQVKAHPAIQDFLSHFPDAEIKDITPIDIEGLKDPDVIDPEDIEDE